MINWYLNRLKSMSLPEMFFRTGQVLRSSYEQIFCAGRFPAQIEMAVNPDGFRYTQRSKKLCPDTFNVFGKQVNYAKGNIDWHMDVFSGNRFPLSFSKSINIRSNPDLSAKNVWEVNRLQFLLFIALDYKHSGKDEYLERFMKIMVSWIDSNPYLIGVNWYSNLEINIRLIVWYFCWYLLDSEKLMISNPKFSQFVRIKWFPCIYQHCSYSYHNPSKYSSSNNHLIAEYAGLFVTTSLWRFRRSDKWNIYAKSGLEQEILRQHSENGVNREEAAGYIQFITDFFLISYMVGVYTNNPFSEKFKTRLGKIFHYIYDILDIAGNFPQYGDEDDGKCVLFDPEENFNNFRSLLTSGALIFSDPILKSKSNGIDMKNTVLFGDDTVMNFSKIEDLVPVPKSAFYKDEGHFIFREYNTDREVYLHFDAAPLGYLSIAAHGHADALSIIMHIDGIPFLVDSGTYTYHTEPDWRNYFIGTLAHNTVRINNRNQATIGGPTLWLNHYKSEILSTEKNDAFEKVKARHNGYRSDGITHCREVEFRRNDLEFIITDELHLQNKQSYSVDLPFHIHPRIKISQEAKNTFILQNPAGKRGALLSLDEKLPVKIINGRIIPEITGWYSKTFMHKEKTNTILGSLEIKENIIFKTRILIKLI